MDFIAGIDPLYTLSGLLVGFLVGMTGVGGGALMTPILVVLFGVHPVTAVGTDLLFAAVTKSVGTAVHGFNKTINWKIVRNLATGSVPAALLALWLVAGNARHEEQSGGLAALIGAILVVVAILLILRPLIVDALMRYQATHSTMSERARSFATVLLGMLLGALVTLTSVGAGAMGVTILLVLFPAMKVRDIIGSDIVHAVPLTLIAGAGYWFLGGIDFQMLAALLTGSVPGVVLGSYLAPRMPDHVLRPVLAAVLAAAGVKMLVS